MTSRLTTALNRPSAKGKRRDVGLNQAPAALPDRIEEGLALEIRWKNAPAVAFLDALRHVTRSATRFDGVQRSGAMESRMRNRIRSIPRYHQNSLSNLAMLASSAGFIMRIPAPFP